jgi:glucose/arabinose dehydrogenase/regulation of enolase protein 1 (concanavalin A-like superfamily)
MQLFSQPLRCALASLILLLALESSAAAPYGLESRAPVAPFLGGTLPSTEPVQSGWRTVKAFPTLTFRYPVGLVPEPRTNRLWVHTREGQVYSFVNNPAVSNKTLVLNLEARNQGWADCGLLGLALHPDFGLADSPRRGYFYVFYQYTMNPLPGPDRPPSNELPAYNRLSRFTVPDGSSVADTNSELILIDQFDRSIWHNGGSMFFNPDDGFLYLALGDEGPNPQYANSQVINKKLFGGVIRIDVNQDPSKSHPIRRQPQSDGGQFSFTANYYIPNDNPFLDSGGSRLEEFWCLGLRSPHRMSYDPVTQSIWLGEVGEITREEINIIEKGGNYQWGYKEGTVTGPQSPPTLLIGTEKPPLYEYSRTNGDNCVIGGYVYRGAEHAAMLGGKYIYGDNGTGRIWAMTTNGAAPPTITYLCNMPPGFGHTGLSSFGIDRSNELYMCQMGNSTYIYKLDFVTTNGNPAPPLLSQLGAFSNLPTLTPASALIPFEVNSPLWSDGAIKTRWMTIPNDDRPYGTNEQIAYSPTNEWLFPAGSVFVKHFELGIDETNSAVRKRLETRFLVRDTNDTVYGLTYKWRSDNSEADVLPDSLSEELTIKLASPIGSFMGQDIGGSTPTGSTTFDSISNVYTVVGGGADIFGANDQFHFAWQQRTGDFDVKVRIESFSPAVHLYTKAGLMARESLTGNSRHVFAAAFTDNQQRADNVSGYEFNVRQANGGAGFALSPPFPQPLVNYPNTWVRLKRTGDLFIAYASQDGVSWKRFATYTLALPQTVYFGMAVTSHSASQTVTARFRDFANNREHVHYYPSRQECLSCHTAAAKGVLGVRTHQLNGLFTYPATGIADNQLRTLNHLGLLNPALVEAQIAALPKLMAVTNASASPEERVRSYLAANCAHCHRPGGVLANFDARHQTPLAQQNLVDGSLRETLGIANAKVIAPGSFSRSMAYLRLNTTDAIKMPPLARNVIDGDAVAAVAEWIAPLVPPGTNAGFAAAYYTNNTLNGTPLIRTDDAVNFDWGFGLAASRDSREQFFGTLAW